MIDRYEIQKIKEIFSDKNKFKIFTSIEILNNLVLGKYELNPGYIYILEKQLELSDNDVKEIREYELETKHETLAFLKWFHLNFKNLSTVHQGLTSSDLLDTAMMIQIEESLNYTLSNLTILLEKIDKKKCSINPAQKILARTHGRNALPIPLQSLFEHWNSLLHNKYRQIINNTKCVYKIAGPVGEKTEEHKTLENYINKIYPSLFPYRDKVTQILPRTIIAEIIFDITMLSSIAEKIATDIRLHAQSNIDELYEPFASSQKGSSAMPHKRNPIICEKICGLSRVVKSHLQVAIDNIQSWNHRDISHSSAERIIIEDSFHLVNHILESLIYVFDGLEINYFKINENLNSHIDSTHFYQYLKTKLAKSHEEAYSISQSFSLNLNKEDFLSVTKILYDYEP